MITPAPLKPGDCLLYAPQGLYGWAIAIKTWHAISHVEIYRGRGRSLAARDRIGVGEFDLRLGALAHVLRPAAPFDFARALETFYRVYAGQGYDWLGLLRFAWRAKVVPDRFDNKQFCSEFATRFYRAGGLDPFPREDADAIAPFQFLLSPVFEEIWRAR